MYRIVKKRAVVITNGGGKPDVEWRTSTCGEYTTQDEAELAFEKIPITTRYNLKVEEFESFEESINTDYLD